MSWHLLRRVRRKNAVTIDGENAVLHRGRVYGARVVGKYSRKAIIDDPFCVALVEGGEPHSVEADKTIKRRKPEIAVGRLCDLTNAVLRQAVVRVPVIESILG